jgi:hypothetical protein
MTDLPTAPRVLQGYDTANFTESHAWIPDFPFEVWANHDALNKSALALGPESSVLSRLVSNRLTPSTSFGVDFGSRSETRPRPGQLVIGGVNAGRFDARTKAEFKMWNAAAPINCPLQVLLADVVLTNDAGSFSLFPDPGFKVSACVDTLQNAFTFTPAMFAKWQGLTGWIADDGSRYTPQTYPLDREHLMGTLTIKLANGYETIIPHHELVSHERGSDGQGKYVVTNSSRVMAAVQSGDSDLGHDIPVLGGVFLSQNYLHVDYESSSFWLSPQIGDGKFPDNIVTTCNATQSNPGTGVGSGNPHLGLEVGLPVAFVVVALGLLALFMYRRRGTQAADKDVAASVTEQAAAIPPAEAGGQSYELDSRA